MIMIILSQIRQKINILQPKYFSDPNTLQAQQVHYDIIHSKGAKGKLVLRVAADE